jgi:hypothetical protein
LFLRVRIQACARPGGGDETGQPRPAFWADDFITGQTINLDGGAKRYHLKVSQIMEANDIKCQSRSAYSPSSRTWNRNVSCGSQDLQQTTQVNVVNNVP